MDTPKHDDGDGSCGLLGRQSLLVEDCHDQVDLEADEFRSQCWKPIGLARCVPGFNDEVLAHDPAQLPQRRDEGIPASIVKGGNIDAKKPEVRDPDGWLRLGGERRGEEHHTRASKERATVHHWVVPVGYLRSWTIRGGGKQVGSMQEPSLQAERSVA